ncbi:MAG: hypothetical protein HY699_05200, partial [Deltaproteobacteria bacterium]|nr:hypothetical protein [Deltaproteobacteria bacterium]
MAAIAAALLLPRCALVESAAPVQPKPAAVELLSRAQCRAVLDDTADLNSLKR